MDIEAGVWNLHATIAADGELAGQGIAIHDDAECGDKSCQIPALECVSGRSFKAPLGEQSSYPIENVLSKVHKFDKIGQTIVADLSTELAVCVRSVFEQQSVRNCDLCRKLALCIRLMQMNILAAMFKPGQGPRISLDEGGEYAWAVSFAAGTKTPPFPVPGKPSLAPVYLLG